MNLSAELSRRRKIGAQKDDWQDRGACRPELHSEDINELFFPANNDAGDYSAAQAICAVCPVRLECLDWALSVNDQNGAWGGMTPPQRRSEVKRRRKQRTREERAS